MKEASPEWNPWKFSSTKRASFWWKRIHKTNEIKKTESTVEDSVAKYEEFTGKDVDYSKVNLMDVVNYFNEGRKHYDYKRTWGY